MKKNIQILALLIFLLGLGACKKATTPQPINLQKPYPKGSDAYYANLRAYKNSDHAVSFNWFKASGQQRSQTNSMGQTWMGIPDSVDIISCWGGRPSDSSLEGKEMRYVQKVKGTKILDVTFLGDGLLSGNGYELSDSGIAKFAKDFGDRMIKDNVDGLDLDYEPTGGDVFFTQDKITLLLQELSKYMGPKSGTNRILDIDGSGIFELQPEAVECLSYLISQAYNSFSPTDLQAQYDAISSWCPPSKFIVTTFFSSNPTQGGGLYNDPIYGNIPALIGFAYWNPTQGRKGGCGSFQLDPDYDNLPHYVYTNQSIQIMNPAVH